MANGGWQSSTESGTATNSSRPGTYTGCCYPTPEPARAPVKNERAQRAEPAAVIQALALSQPEYRHIIENLFLLEQVELLYPPSSK